MSKNATAVFKPLDASTIISKLSRSFLKICKSG
jgi:hypothetical protein